MNSRSTYLFVSDDHGLLQHWHKALGQENPQDIPSFEALANLSIPSQSIAWLDLNMARIPAWDHAQWEPLLKNSRLRVVAASSNPKDAEAIEALDAGCAAYCHAYSDPATLVQIQQVTEAGHIWIGQNLMQQLIQTANRAKPVPLKTAPAWENLLTHREREVAQLASHGASNLQIAERCEITERTVKAHLSAVFEKLGVVDRLQLALKFHGIQ